MANDDKRMTFTKTAIEAFPAAEKGKRVEYWDAKVPGLQVRVTDTGAKTFYVKRRSKNGEVERIMLGRFPSLPIERAREQAAKYIAELTSGNSPAEAARLVKGEHSFGDLFNEYLTRHAKLNKRTWKEDEQKYRDYLEKPLGKKKISKITRKDLADIHSKITMGGHSTLANRVKDLLSSIFGRAVKWGLMETNPAKGIEDNRETSRERFLKPDELPKLFQALAEEPNTIFRDFFLLALLTGARRSNVRTMRWTELDLDANVWRIPGEISKNGQPLHVPLVPEAINIIGLRREAVPPDCEYVFPASRSDSKLGHLSGERKAWLRILARAGLEDVRIHDLRRTMGSWQARTGASLVVIGKTLGHKSQQATAVYARLDLDPVRQAMETAASAMLEAGQVKATADVVPIRKAKIA